MKSILQRPIDLMKIHFLTLALLGSAFSPFTMAQAPDDLAASQEKLRETGASTPSDATPRDVPKSLRIQLEYIELSHEALTRLLFLAEPKTSDARPLREQLQEMVGKNEARVIETQFAAGNSGQKFTAESILEFIYPTEYEPPSLPCGGSPKPKDPFHEDQVTSMMPTAFDTRNTGSTFEVEPTTTEEGKFINIRLLAELVWHTGNSTWLEHKDNIGNDHKVQMPDFNTLRLNTSVSCLKGQYTLVGVLSPKNDKGDVDMTRKIVMLLKCDVLAVK